MVGRHGEGQWFSHIDLNAIKQILEGVKDFNNKYLSLHFNLGAGAYQEYTFTKKQLNMLIPQLEELLDEEWYEEKY